MRNHRVFIGFLLAFILFDYLVIKHSFLWILVEFCLIYGVYYLLYEASFSKKWSNLFKIIVSVGIGGLAFGATLIIPNSSSWQYQGSEYNQATKSFYSIDSSRIEENLKEQKKLIRYVYVGRESCPFCNAFAPKLKQAAKEAKVSVYYIDTENKTDELYNFAEQYNVDSIPTLLVMKVGQLEKILTDISQLSIEELTVLLKDNK